MVSGALFLNPKREIKTRDIFHKYIKRILICYAAWTVLYAIFYTVLDKGDLQNMNMTFVPGYMGLFLMGHYIHEYGLGKWHRTVVFLVIPALLISAGFTILFSVLTDAHVYTFMLESNPLVVLASAGIFAFFRWNGKKARIYDRESPVSRAMIFTGGNTFGLYLVHLAVLDSLDHYLGFNVASFAAILSVPVISILIFFIALAIAAVMKKIPIVKIIVS